MESAFLWLLRADASGAPHYGLNDLAGLDFRVLAHLDGLLIAGDAGWEIAAKELAWKEPGEVFAAGVLAFESGEAERIEAVLGVAAGDPELAPGLISALGWLEFDRARPHIEALLADSDPARRRIGVRAAAVHRWAIPEHFAAAAASDDPALAAAGLRAAGELGDAGLLATCRGHLASEVPELRFWAAWSLGLRGDGSALPVLQETVASDSPFAGRALDVAGRRLDLSSARTWHARLLEGGHQRAAVQLPGRLGDPSWIPWLLEQMAQPELARPAGESFSFITGVDLAYEDLETDWPDGFEAGPTESPEDPDVAMDEDEDLPWPDPVLLEKWWSQNQRRFQPGARHLLGQPITAESAALALREGKQRQRAAAALELARLEGGPLFEVRAPGFRQKQLLGVSGRA